MSLRVAFLFLFLPVLVVVVLVVVGGAGVFARLRLGRVGKTVASGSTGLGPNFFFFVLLRREEHCTPRCLGLLIGERERRGAIHGNGGRWGGT